MIDVCGISKHIHLEEDADVLFEDFCLLFGDGDPEKRRTLIPPVHYLTKSWALILLRLGESGRQSVGDLVCRSCWEKWRGALPGILSVNLVGEHLIATGRPG